MRTKLPTKIVFVICYKLPWISEPVMAIYNYAPGGSLKMDKETKQYCVEVSAYVSFFFDVHLADFFWSWTTNSKKAVAEKIRTAMGMLFNKVLCNGHPQLSKQKS